MTLVRSHTTLPRLPPPALPVVAPRRRVKELMGPKPHNQGDAEWAAGMGAPDNGQRQAAAPMAQ
jgi:hypothetical protein